MAKSKTIREQIEELDFEIYLNGEYGKYQYSHLSEEEYFTRFADDYISDVSRIILLFEKLKKAEKLTSAEKLCLHNWKRWKRKLQLLQTGYNYA